MFALVRLLAVREVTYGCLFSGVGCSTLAFAALGWTCAFHAETDPFASAVRRHHWPDVPNLGDVTAVDWSQWRGKMDLMMGSPPCQDFSVAGKRAGAGGARGNLSMTWAEIVNATDPIWSITENVPGWLTSRDNAFGAFIGALVGGGTVEPPGGKWRAAGVVVGPARSAAWRIIDAQHLGVPQRRRRVFVVTGRAGSGADPVAVLFERKRVRGHSAQSETERQKVAGTLGGGSGQRGWCDDLDRCGAFVTHSLCAAGFASEDGTGRVVANAVTCHHAKGGDPTTDNYVVADPLSAASGGGGQYCNAGNNPRPRNVVVAFDPVQATSAENRSRFDSDVCHTLARDNAARATLCFSSKDYGADVSALSPTLRAAGHTASHANGGAPPAVVMAEARPRRLTPTECERLQGMPDGHTLIQYRGKPASDGPRYRAIGNGIAVPALRWIAQRIEQAQP